MKTSKYYMRELLSEAINVLVRGKSIDLNSLDDSEGKVSAELFGKNSMILWRGIGFGELTVIVWWGVKKGIILGSGDVPLNANMKEALDLCCSCWLERKNGKWIQGSGKNHITSTYCSIKARSELAKIHDVEPLGFEKSGKFYL